MLLIIHCACVPHRRENGSARSVMVLVPTDEVPVEPFTMVLHKATAAAVKIRQMEKARHVKAGGFVKSMICFQRVGRAPSYDER